MFLLPVIVDIQIISVFFSVTNNVTMNTFYPFILDTCVCIYNRTESPKVTLLVKCAYLKF